MANMLSKYLMSILATTPGGEDINRIVTNTIGMTNRAIICGY